MMWRRMAVVGLLAAGCQASDRVQIMVENVDDHTVAAYYFGMHLGADPFESGVFSTADDGLFLNVDKLGDLRPGLDASLQPYLSGRQLEWDSLLAFAESAYDLVRQMPVRLADLVDSSRADEILEFDVHGPMTRYMRRIRIPGHALRAALKLFDGNGRRVVYPLGTVIVASHLDSEQVVESTAMLKRPDGYWEFGTYDQTGQRTFETQSNPRSLATPRQCVGCHFGTRKFEPEKSFPGPAAPGPDGVRHWYTDARDPAVTGLFDEHERRSDAVLGIYATVYATELIRARETGQAPAEDLALLAELGL